MSYYGYQKLGTLTQRDCRDMWYQVARIRERNGDKAGAERARTSAWIIGDPRPRGTKRSSK